MTNERNRDQPNAHSAHARHVSDQTDERHPTEPDADGSAVSGHAGHTMTDARAAGVSGADRANQATGDAPSTGHAAAASTASHPAGGGHNGQAGREQAKGGHAGHTMDAGSMPNKSGMEENEPGLMMAMHHNMVRWVDLALLGLGLWLLISPATLGYPSTSLTWSDVLSGGLLIIFAACSYWGRQWWAPYAATLVGTWLVFAPLVFWAPDAGSYANDTLIGAAVIGLAILIPHGMDMGGPQIPRGWNYNPSSWPQRAPIIALGMFGFLTSRYMAAYQLGHISSVWDPFFAGGTERVLDSDISRMFPVSDSGLGAAVYLLEVLMVIMGDPRRWRTMPWMVAFFAILVVPLGVTSIILVILQPLAVGDWCTLCLVAALAMLVMVPLTLDELVAMIQLMAQRRRAGASLWRVFWLGANQAEGEEAQPVRPLDSSAPAAMVWGVTIPWSLLLSTFLGGWLLLAPAVFGTEESAVGDGDRLVGALIITVTMIALAEVVRPLRFLNAVFGLWLLIQPWLLGGTTGAIIVSDLAVGAALIALSIPRGAVRERYGGWQRTIV